MALVVPSTKDHQHTSLFAKAQHQIELALPVFFVRHDFHNQKKHPELAQSASLVFLHHQGCAKKAILVPDRGKRYRRLNKV